jgi:hypothetical protein
MYVVVSNNGISTYKLSCVVCFKCFLLVGVCYISYGGFQTKVYKIGGYYSVRMTKKKRKKKKEFLCENSMNSIPLRS